MRRPTLPAAVGVSVAAVAAAAGVIFMACAPSNDGANDPATAHQASAIGEPMNGFPSAAERLGIMAINRARSDPETVAGPQSTSYPARAPVLWSYELSRSARFHATNLRLANVTLMHSSPCTLNTDVAATSCDGNPTCACATPVPAMCASCAKVDAVNTCGTETFTRVGYFTTGSGISASGEVAAAGYADAMAVVDGWMDEAAGADGHRKNLTDQGITSNVMGYGRSEGAACYSSFDVSDSGKVSGAVIPKIPTAAVRAPNRGVAGSYTFYATWADPAMGAPSSLNVVVDGACTAMAREMGTDTLNATYKATATLAAGCHNYYVTATDGAGAAVAFPTTGAIALSVAGVACASDFLTPAPAASCGGDGGVPISDGGVGSNDARADATAADAARGTGGSGAGTGGNGNTGTGGSGAGGRIGTGGSGAGGRAGTGGATSGTGGAGTGAGGRPGTGGAATGTGGRTGTGGGGPDAGTPDNSVSGGCNCAVASNDGAGASGFLMVLMGALVVAGRGRRGRGRR